MPEALKMPDGSEFVVVRTPADPESDPSEIHFTVMPDGPAPPPHVHPRQREIFTALEGDSFELLLDGEWRTLPEGESLAIEPGQAHTYRNRGSGTVRVRTVHEPGLDFERYVRRIQATAQGQDSLGMSPAMLVRMAILWGEHSDTIRPAPLPLRIAMPVMAALGRLAGVRPAE